MKLGKTIILRTQEEDGYSQGLIDSLKPKDKRQGVGSTLELEDFRPDMVAVTSPYAAGLRDAGLLHKESVADLCNTPIESVKKVALMRAHREAWKKVVELGAYSALIVKDTSRFEGDMSMLSDLPMQLMDRFDICHVHSKHRYAHAGSKGLTVPHIADPKVVGMDAYLISGTAAKRLLDLVFPCASDIEAYVAYMSATVEQRLSYSYSERTRFMSAMGHSDDDHIRAYVWHPFFRYYSLEEVAEIEKVRDKAEAYSLGRKGRSYWYMGTYVPVVEPPDEEVQAEIERDGQEDIEAEDEEDGDIPGTGEDENP